VAQLTQSEKKRAYNRSYYRKNKDAMYASNLKWRQANREKINACSRKNYYKNPVTNLFINARSRSREKGIEFTITKEDIVIPKTCPLLGTPIKIGGGDWAPSLDRINGDLGYVPGNVMVVSFRANYIKSNATYQELEILAANLKKIVKG